MTDGEREIDGVVLVFDAASHPADAIQRAGYRYCDRFSMALARDGDNFRCHLAFTGPVDWAIVAEFRTEVLDQILRQRIRTETEGVRNVILALAFSHLTSDEQPAVDAPADIPA